MPEGEDSKWYLLYWKNSLTNPPPPHNKIVRGQKFNFVSALGGATFSWKNENQQNVHFNQKSAPKRASVKGRRAFLQKFCPAQICWHNFVDRWTYVESQED